MTVIDSEVAAWLAGMIDVLRAVAADAAINRPIHINRANVNSCCADQTTFDFTAGNSLTRIFSDFVTFAIRLGGKTAEAVNG